MPTDNKNAAPSPLSDSDGSLVDSMYDKRIACIDRSNHNATQKMTSKVFRKYKKHINAQYRWLNRIRKFYKRVNSQLSCRSEA